MTKKPTISTSLARDATSVAVKRSQADMRSRVGRRPLEHFARIRQRQISYRTDPDSEEGRAASGWDKAWTKRRLAFSWFRYTSRSARWKSSTSCRPTNAKLSNPAKDQGKRHLSRLVARVIAIPQIRRELSQIAYVYWLAQYAHSEGIRSALSLTMTKSKGRLRLLRATRLHSISPFLRQRKIATLARART